MIDRGGASNLELSKIYNALMKSVLRSPLHGMVSKNFMLITFTGRRSGKVYTTPVNYVRDGDSILSSASVIVSGGEICEAVPR